MLRHEKGMIDEQSLEVAIPLTCIINYIHNDMDYCDKYVMHTEMYGRLALEIPFISDPKCLIIHRQLLIPNTLSPTPGTFSSTSLPIPTHCDP